MFLAGQSIETHSNMDTTNDFSDVIIEERSSSYNENKTKKVITCYSEKLDLKFVIDIHNEAIQSQQKCFFLTIHDIGQNSSQFDDFVQSEKMTGIRNRAVWLHVNLPGQEIDATDLNIKKYPSLEELGDELVCIIDYLKIPQVVCIGSGAGANICAHFAIKHKSRCLGLILIEPIASSASLIETMKFKLRRLNTKSTSLNGSFQEKANLLLNRITCPENDDVNNTTTALVNQTENEINTQKDPLETLIEMNKTELNKGESSNSSGSLSLPVNDIQEINIEKLESTGQNFKNLKLFSDSFSVRSSLIDKVKDLNVDILTAVGKDSHGYNESKRFFRSLQENRKKDPKKLVNCPFLDIENSINVLKDKPERLATSLQYFLQGIGLLSAMPMKSNIIQSKLSLYGRSISMEEADRPRSSSIKSDSLTSPMVSSNPSITDSN